MVAPVDFVSPAPVDLKVKEANDKVKGCVREG